MKRSPMPISDQLSLAIAHSGLSLRELGRRVGVDSGVLGRFMRRERGLTLVVADRLAVYFGLHMVARRRGTKKQHQRTR